MHLYVSINFMLTSASVFLFGWHPCAYIYLSIPGCVWTVSVSLVLLLLPLSFLWQDLVFSATLLTHTPELESWPEIAPVGNPAAAFLERV